MEEKHEAAPWWRTRPKPAPAAAPLQAPAKPRTFPLFVLLKFNPPTVNSGVQQLPEVPPEKGFLSRTDSAGGKCSQQLNSHTQGDSCLPGSCSSSSRETAQGWGDRAPPKHTQPWAPGCQQRLQNPPCKLQRMGGRVKGTLLGACRCCSLINTPAAARINGQVRGHAPARAPGGDWGHCWQLSLQSPGRAPSLGLDPAETPLPPRWCCQWETGTALAPSWGSTAGATNPNAQVNEDMRAHSTGVPPHRVQKAPPPSLMFLLTVL